MSFEDFQASRKKLSDDETIALFGSVRPHTEENFCYNHEDKHYLIAKIDGLFEYFWSADGIDVAEFLWEAEDNLYLRLSEAK